MLHALVQGQYKKDHRWAAHIAKHAPHLGHQRAETAMPRQSGRQQGIIVRAHLLPGNPLLEQGAKTNTPQIGFEAHVQHHIAQHCAIRGHFRTRNAASLRAAYYCACHILVMFLKLVSGSLAYSGSSPVQWSPSALVIASAVLLL